MNPDKGHERKNPKQGLHGLHELHELRRLDISVRPDPIGVPRQRPKRPKLEITSLESQGALFTEQPEKLLATVNALSLPPVDRALFPKTVEDLNTLLGADLVRSVLTIREDQMQPLFQMFAAGTFHFIIKAPTGYGKTPLAALVCAAVVSNSLRSPVQANGKPILYLVPYRALAPQVKNEFLRFLSLPSESIGILDGQTPKAERRALLGGQTDAKIIIALPKTLTTSLDAVLLDSDIDPILQFSFVFADEFHVAEGEHAMAKAIARAVAAGLQVLSVSGSPFRNEEDLAAKRSLLRAQGIIVPPTLPPLKQHELLEAFVSPLTKGSIAELSRLIFGHYVSAREALLNAQQQYSEATGGETPSLFPEWKRPSNLPNVKSFSRASLAWIVRNTKINSDLGDKILQSEGSAPDSETRTRLAKAHALSQRTAIEIARVRSIGYNIDLLESFGKFAFCSRFAEIWIPSQLYPTHDRKRLDATHDYAIESEFRTIVRGVLEGTPYRHLLDSRTLPEALERAFGVIGNAIPIGHTLQHSLFSNLALYEMTTRAGWDHPKERNLFRRLEELSSYGQRPGILVFAEPRNYALFLSLRIQHLLAAKGYRAAYVTGAQRRARREGFSTNALAYLEALKHEPRTLKTKTPMGTWPEVQISFQSKEINVIVATSRLGTGVNMPTADEAHVMSVNGDAIKFLQHIGRVGRPKDTEFHLNVGQCFYHVARNTTEIYRFRSTLNKYGWLKDSFKESERWPLADGDQESD